MAWDFMEEDLKGFGFPDQYKKLVMTCVTTSTFSVLLNGTLVDYFPRQRWLRQGVVLSPFLFVIGMEYLSCKLAMLKTDADFAYISPEMQASGSHSPLFL